MATTATNKLTAVKVKTAAVGKHFDGGGLFLDVKPNGARYWRMKYCFAGKEGLLAFGVYPEVSLAEVRRRRDDARALLRDSRDPAAVKRETNIAAKVAAANSYEAVAREWLDTKAGEWMPAHSAKVRVWLEQHVFPWIGTRPIADLEAPEVLAMLQRLVKRGTLNTAGRIRETVSAIFRYAIATGRCKRNPAADLRDALPKTTAKNFAALTEPSAIAELLRAIEGYGGYPATLAALRLAPMLFQRPGELRGMTWAELDLDAAEWRIPAPRRKLRRAAKENPRTAAHVVPLSTQAVAILRDLHALTGRGVYVFPGARSPQQHLSNMTINAALRRLGFTTEQMTGHGFRHMASTRLNEMGWNPDAIERQLSHRDKDEIRGTYNLAQYMAERRKMMQAWADYLDALRTGANVVAIKRKARASA